MERLTSKETREKITNRLMPYQFNADVTITQKQFFDMYDKLLAFEDFMEEQGFEDLQDLEKYIALTIKSSEIVAKKRQEIRTLKGNWEKLREFVGHERICVDDGFQEVYDAYGCVLDKMQELEGGDGRNKQ